jgi:hypothetical protein
MTKRKNVFEFDLHKYHYGSRAVRRGKRAYYIWKKRDNFFSLDIEGLTPKEREFVQPFIDYKKAQRKEIRDHAKINPMVITKNGNIMPVSGGTTISFRRKKKEEEK